MKKGKRLIWNILRRALLAVAAVTVGLNIYMWNANSLVGDQLPMPFGYGAAVVLTGSMGEALPVDSLIFVKAQSQCEVGQIVVYQSGRSMIVHRVVAIDGDSVTTRGDANNTDDTPIPQASVRGIVVGQIPGVGALVRGLKTPLGMLCVLALAVCLVELSYRRERKDDEAEKQQILAQIRALKEENKPEDGDVGTGLQ